MDLNPIHHLSPANKWNAHIFWIMFNFWWSAGLVDGLKPHLPPLSSQKMKCSFLDYIQLLMISRAGQWTWTPSTTPLQPKNEMLIFVLHSTSDVGQTGQWTWTSSTTPLQPKNEMLIFGLCSTSDDKPGCSMNSNSICHPSPANKMKCSFLDYVQLLMISWACRWTWTPSTTCLQPKNEMLIFWLCSTSDDWPGCVMDSNHIHHPSPANKMKCFFLDYVQLLMISQAGWWTQTPSATPLQPIKWNAFFLDYVHFWWSARLVNGLKPHLPPLSSQKNEMLTFGLHSFWMISQAGQWTQTPSTTPLHPKKWNAHFWIMFNFWWSAGLVNGLKPHLPLLSYQPRNEMLIFWIHSTSDDQPGWSMDSNPICHPSPTKKMKCSFLK